MSEKISACIIAFNEEDNIRSCLESVTWCDEIIVVDSFSTDRTVEICREYTDRVVQRPWSGYIDQRNFVHGLATHPWVLFLDADEQVSNPMRQQIHAVLDNPPDDVDGFEFPRLVYYLGRWIRHGEWYPDRKLRFFRKDKGQTGGIEPHDCVHVQGKVGRLDGPLLHYTYDGLADHLDSMNRFSSISAQAKQEHGESFRWRDFLIRPCWRFFRGYVVRRGFLDGLPGLIIACVNAFGVSMKYAKLWEVDHQREAGAATSSVSRTLGVPSDNENAASAA